MGNPFGEVASTTTPFDGMSEEGPVGTKPNGGMSDKSVDMTARMAVLALHSSDEILHGYQELTAQYAQTIKTSGDDSLRVQAATRQQMDQFNGLSNLLRAQHLDVDPELQAGAKLAAQQTLQHTIDQRKEYALESMALDKIKDLASSGNYVQAKVQMNLIEHGDPEQVINRVNLNRMIIDREVQKAQVAKNDQPWFRDAVDWVMGAVAPFTLNGTMDRVGLADVDKSLQHWTDYLLSGKRERAEISNALAHRPDEFAKIVREQIIPRIKDHSSFLNYTSNSEVLNLLSEVRNTPSVGMTNVMQGIDLAGLASILPISKVISIPSIMIKSGAVKEAADAMAHTSLASIKMGSKAAEEATGISLDDIAEHAVPGGVNMSADAAPATGDTMAARARGVELLSQFETPLQVDRMSEVELQNAVEKRSQELRQEIGRPLKDFQIGKEVLEDGSHVHYFDITIGKSKGGGFSSESVAQSEAKRQGMAGSEITSDSGGFFIKQRRYLNEDGFYNTPLDPGLKKTGIIGRIFLGSRQIDDDFTAGLARAAANSRNKMMKQFHDAFHSKLVGVEGAEKNYLQQAMAWGENNSTWLNRDELDELFARQGAKQEASDKAWDAYNVARDINDIEYVLRNDTEWKRLVTHGAESVSFDGTALSADRETAFVARTAPSTTVSGRIYDVENGTHHTEGLSSEALKAKTDEGYVLVRLKGERELADGTTVKNLLMKRERMSAEPLRRDQVAYRAGGHRMYADKYFVKQAVYGTQADTGEKFLKNPNTYISGTKAEVQAWEGAMERARKEYNVNPNSPDLAKLDEHLAGIANIDGEDFVRMVGSGEIQADTKFVAMFDRELPEEYLQRGAGLDYVDTEETGFTGWLRTNGRMYYSSKGTKLHDWQGGDARTVDPFEATNEALNNIANITSFSDYKMSAVSRWINTFSDNLDTTSVPRGASDLTKFSEYKALSNLDKRPMGAGAIVREQMEAQRDIIKRNLGWRTQWDRETNRFTLQMQDFVMGSDPTSRQHAIGKRFVNWWEKDVGNPLNAARGLAFDMKMGLFNIAQFPLQVQTLLATLALSPDAAAASLINAGPMRAYLSKAGSEGLLDGMIDRGMAHIADITPDEYRNMMRSAKQSGFFDFGRDHQLINSSGPSSVVGGFKDGWDKFTRIGRFAFNEGEVWNRMSAWQVAWKENLLKYDGKMGTDFLRDVQLRADDYSMNMMSQSSANWQHGIASVPTQFWAYNARMMEALLGKQFTRQQRLNLLVSQTFFYGAAGAPIVGIAESLAHWAKVKAGLSDGTAPQLDTAAGIWDRGVIDEVIWKTFGANVLAGKRYGTGSFVPDLVGSILGTSPYGEKSFADTFGGATLNILGQSGDTLYDLVRHSVAESGSGDYPLLKDDFNRLALNVSTYSYGMKAYLGYRYQIYQSNKGTLTAKDLPTADAFWFALGLPPGERDDVGAASEFLKDKKKAVNEASTFFQQKQGELATMPDKRSQISAEIAAYSNLLPPDIRTAALRRVHLNAPVDLHTSFAQQIEQEKAAREAMKSGQTN